jgi:hypothetical protein
MRVAASALRCRINETALGSKGRAGIPADAKHGYCHTITHKLRPD